MLASHSRRKSREGEPRDAATGSHWVCCIGQRWETVCMKYREHEAVSTKPTKIYNDLAGAIRAPRKEGDGGTNSCPIDVASLVARRTTT